MLPFANLSGDPSQDYLADVITDELTTGFSRFRTSFVISRSTAFTYKGKPINVRQIGKDLGVRCALEGSVQPSGDRLRVNAQLMPFQRFCVIDVFMRPRHRPSGLPTTITCLTTTCWSLMTSTMKSCCAVPPACTGHPVRDLAAVLEGAPEGVTVILLDHQPSDARHAAKLGVALQLSGHTHGGLILGIDRLAARANAGYVSGRYDVDGMTLYVNNGTALWPGFALRLGRPSELTRITLRQAGAA